MSALLGFIKNAGLVFFGILLLLRFSLQFRPVQKARYSAQLPWADRWLAGCLLLFLVTNFLFPLYYVPSRSMEPTLQVGDGIVVNGLAYWFRKPRRGEIVVFRGPDGRHLVKRIVAVEGDAVTLEQGRLWVGSSLHTQRNDRSGGTGEEHTVGVGAIFVLGDNRENSTDSRVFGDIPQAALVGPVWLRYFPPLRAGRL